VLTRTPGISVTLHHATPAEQAEFEEWLAGWTKQPRYDYATRGLSATLTSLVAFQRGDELWALVSPAKQKCSSPRSARDSGTIRCRSTSWR